ncbi:hypothetical protein AACH06_27805 [Ideonella sp. DXS29W]|uniref:Secreted protein n=1 Tax=Ideonella lacteola TaxID=2984193 RepID=A0ABU9BY06_9BURK
MRKVSWAPWVALGCLSVSSAMADDSVSRWNASAEPVAPYGHCGNNSSLGSKLETLPYVGEPVTDVLAIKVLRCDHFGGGGGFAKRPCPSDSAFDFCLGAGNDGRGNSVDLGVLKVSPRSDPNALYEGCPNGASPQPKIGVLIAAGRDPRTISGMVTLACAAATTARAMVPTAVDCPAGRHPFNYCVQTSNDGHGNAVLLGVLHVRGAGDPQGLYGECDQQIAPGFSTKASVLALVGKSTQNLRGIDLLGCAVPWGIGGDFPAGLHAGACIGNKWVSQAVAGRYDYCVWGTDARNAGIVFGVNGP